MNEVKELEDVIKKLFEEQSTQKSKKNRVRMRKAESSVNQSYQGEELPLQATENRKVKADKNYVYFKLSDLMGDNNERENREFLATTIHV